MEFVSSFLSYLILMIVFVIVGAIAIFIGITLRKTSNAKALLQQDEETEASEQAGA